MVLGIRLAVAAAMFAGGCSAAPAPQSKAQQAATPSVSATVEKLDSATVGGRSLDLIRRGDDCVLRVADKAKPLELGDACRFLRNRPGAAPASYAYGDRGAVVLVAGPPASAADYPSDMGQKPSDRCSNVGRAVIVRGDRVELSDVLTEAIGFCPDIAPDEKYFHGIAHQERFAARTAVQ